MRKFDPKGISGLRGLLLYGSAARGDADIDSDMDYCAIVDDMSFEAVLDIRLRLSIELNEFLESVAVYTQSAFSEACQRGSLFFEHIKLEGRLLYDRDGVVADGLGAMAPFERYADEIELYHRLLVGIKESLAATGALSYFDLHVLHGIVRDACIMMTYRQGKPSFGRESAFRAARESFPQLPLSVKVHAKLAEGHITYTRRMVSGIQAPFGREAQEIVEEVEALMAFCAKVVL